MQIRFKTDIILLMDKNLCVSKKPLNGATNGTRFDIDLELRRLLI